MVVACRSLPYAHPFSRIHKFLRWGGIVWGVATERLHHQLQLGAYTHMQHDAQESNRAAAEDDNRRSTTLSRYQSEDGAASGYNTLSTTSHHSTGTECSSQLNCHDLNANHHPTMAVGAVYESGPSTVRYVYRPCVLRPSFEPSTQQRLTTSTRRESKEYDLHPRATSVVGSFTPSSVRYKDKKGNVKSQYKEHKEIQYKEHDKSHQYQENDKQLLQPNKTTVSMIEVSPGHEAKLRGAAETWQHAIQHDFYVPCACLECDDASLFCILDAWLVLCPHCRGLNSIGLNDNGHCDDIMATTTNPDGGVGLGFTIETLMEAQASMLRDY
jgi:hypothetical protein